MRFTFRVLLFRMRVAKSSLPSKEKFQRNNMREIMEYVHRKSSERARAKTLALILVLYHLYSRKLSMEKRWHDLFQPTSLSKVQSL